MGIYNTVSFNKDDNHSKGFSSSTNIYPGPAVHTALYLEIEHKLITMSPHEDKSQRILRVTARVTWLGLHFDHVCDPLGPCRGCPITAPGKSIPSVMGGMGWWWSRGHPRDEGA